ncbi:MAG: acyltransferase [Enterobacter sp.]|nr:acyltransferase [Enterobacter sp.]
MEISVYSLAAILTLPVIIMGLVYVLSPSFIKASLDNDPGKYSMIEPLRGVAALIVVIHHSFFSYNLTYHEHWKPINSAVIDLPQQVINIISSLGGMGVIFFFMITGFLFTDKALTSEGRVDFKKFYIGRFFRIVPAYLFLIVLVIFIVIVTGFREYGALSDYVSVLASWLSMGMTKPYTISSRIDNYLIVAGVLWTLGVEWKFYFLYPLLCQFAKVKVALISLISILLLVCILMLTNFFEGINGGIFLSFITGGISAVIIKINNGRFNYLLRGSALPLIGLIACGSALWSGYDVYSIYSIFGMFIIFISIINGSSIFGLLRLSPIRWLGAISYSLYLSHGVFLFVFNKVVLNGSGYFIPAIFAIFSAIVFSVISYCYVECRGISFGRKLSNGTPINSSGLTTV